LELKVGGNAAATISSRLRQQQQLLVLFSSSLHRAADPIPSSLFIYPETQSAKRERETPPAAAALSTPWPPDVIKPLLPFPLSLHTHTHTKSVAPSFFFLSYIYM
jgi:hypothetical protein